MALNDQNSADGLFSLEIKMDWENSKDALGFSYDSELDVMQIDRDHEGFSIMRQAFYGKGIDISIPLTHGLGTSVALRGNGIDPEQFLPALGKRIINHHWEKKAREEKSHNYYIDVKPERDEEKLPHPLDFEL